MLLLITRGRPLLRSGSPLSSSVRLNTNSRCLRKGSKSRMTRTRSWGASCTVMMGIRCRVVLYRLPSVDTTIIRGQLINPLFAAGGTICSFTYFRSMLILVYMLTLPSFTVYIFTRYPEALDFRTREEVIEVLSLDGTHTLEDVR